MKYILNLYRNAYSGLSPSTWWLSLVLVINRSGTMVVPFMTLYLTQSKHYNIAKAGTVMAMFGAGAVCGGLLGGKLTDKLGFYNVQIGGLLCGGIMFLILGNMDSYPAILACTFLLALLNDTFRPANATAVAHYSKEENRIRSFSLNRLSNNLGWAVGGALGGIIAARNYHLLFWIDGITNMLAAILLLIVLAPSRNATTPAHKDRSKVAPTRLPYHDTGYLLFIVFTILFGCMFYQMFATLPVFFNQKLHLSPIRIGIVMAFNGLLIVLFEMALIYKLEPRNIHIRIITTGVLILGLSFVTYNLLPGAFVLALFATTLLTAGEMLAMPFMNLIWVKRTDHTNRGQYAGLYTVAWSIAQVAGPFAGTQIAQHYSFNLLWWLLGGLSICLAIGIKLIRLKA
jgi:predicted MFS family arabinose efflux permease